MASHAFRTSFTLSGRKLNKWNPGHMVRGGKVMNDKLRIMDLLIEVHDARIPITGRNLDFRERYTAAKPHILLLNKSDLVDTKYNDQVERYLIKNQGINRVMYTNLSGDATWKREYSQILPVILKLVDSSDRHHRADAPEVNIMVIGIPNVGKSSFLNRTRQNFKLKCSSTVGPVAGVTRSVQERIKLSGHPPIYLYDTPGIVYPKFSSIESYMKLALVACLDDSVIGYELIADYGLYWLNKNLIFSYVPLYDMDGPSDNISNLLFKICVRHDYFSRRNNNIYPNIIAAAKHFLKDFRTGKLGKFMLDCDELAKTS